MQLLEKQRYLSKDAILYNYTAYLSPDGGSYALYLEAPDSSTAFIAKEGSIAPATPGSPPADIDGYTPLTRADLMRGGHTQKLVTVSFGDETDAFQVSDKQLGKAAQFQQQYTYLPDQDAVRDNETDVLYFPQAGTYTAADGTLP